MVLDEHPLTDRLKSAVTRRKGRGFSSAIADNGPNTNSTMDYEQLPNAEYSGRAQRSIEGWTLFLTGLHEECTEDDLTDLLSEYGLLRGIRLNLDHRTGYVKGYAVVEYNEYEEARRAQENLDGLTFMDGAISADFAFIKPPQLTFHRHS